MIRFATAMLLFVFTISPAFALKVAAPPGVLTRAATAELTATGKVTAIEKDEVEIVPYVGSTQKVSYKVAVVKVDEVLIGKTSETHIKIGFQPVAPRLSIRSDLRAVSTFEFKPDAEGTFFLRKDATSGIYLYDYNTLPLDATAKTYKADLEVVKKAATAIADPMKALKAKDAKDSYFAAAAIVAKYRASSGNAKVEAVATEESKLILKTILEADWTAFDNDVPSPYQTFMKLGMTQQDGWKPAQFNGNGDFNAHMKDEFKKWLEGDGAKFQIKKFVAK